MGERVDLVLVNPGNRRQNYQNLAARLSGIEPPLWVGLLAESARRRGYSVQVVDADAEELSPEETAERVARHDPLLTGVIVFGANPSASTMKMPAAGAICTALRKAAPATKTILGGVHVSALPERTLCEEDVDFVMRGEGPYTLAALVELLRAGRESWQTVPGLSYRRDGRVASNPPAPLIQDLDAELPGAAWELLPMEKYRAHNWHCFEHVDRRSPYAVIYTSLGCPFNCSFCCINALFGKPGIRYRSPASVVAEIDLLVRRYGVRNIKIIDELFVLKRDRVAEICDLLIERGYDSPGGGQGLNMWAYARVDTVAPELLAKMRRAGVRWLAYGFESASAAVRDGVAKRFSDETVERAIRMTREAGIHIIANFIFGLPDDDLETMRQTLEMARRHNFEFVNFYCAMAYPGSRLHETAVAEGWPLPEGWEGYSQFGADALPLPTKHLSAGQVLRFRDRAFVEYFADPRYLRMVAEKFGPVAQEHVQEMLKYKMVRKHAAPGQPALR